MSPRRPGAAVPLALALLALIGAGFTREARGEWVRVQARTSVWVELSEDGSGIVGWLADDRGVRLPGRRLLVQIGDGPSRWVTTDEAGRFETPTLPPPGGTAVRATFPGGPFHAPSGVERILDPGRRQVRLELVAPAEASLASESSEIQLLTEVDGAPASLPVTVSLQGARAPVAQVTTGASGWGHAPISHEAFAVPGHHALVARFAGTDDLAPALARAEIFVVEPTSLVLESSHDRVRLGDRLRLHGRLATPRGPLPREEVRLAAGGSLLAVARTDEMGRFSERVDATDLGSGGTVEVQASYASPSRSRESSRSAVLGITLSRPAPLSPWAVGIPALLTALAIALILAGTRRRRRRSRRESRLPSAHPAASGVTRDGRRRRTAGSPSYSIAGVVWDGVEERPVPGAMVVVAGRSGQRLIEADSSGSFRAGPLETGTFTVTVSAAAYVPESFTVACPHEGGALGLRVRLVQIRHRALEAYRAAATPLLPTRALWGYWTPREIAVHAARERPPIADDVADLTSSFEGAYYSGAGATMEDLERVRALSRAVADRGQ